MSGCMEIEVTFSSEEHFDCVILNKETDFVVGSDGLSGGGIPVVPTIGNDKILDLTVMFDDEDDFNCAFSETEALFECELGDCAYQRYDEGYGYEVTPTAYEQMLPTKNKILVRNVIVHKTPYYETSNEAGGYTATIL